MTAHRSLLAAASCLLALVACASSPPPPPTASPPMPAPSAEPAPSSAATSSTAFVASEDPMIVEWHGGPKIPAPSDVARAPADADRTSSGLVTKILRHGTGADHPSPRAHVVVRYSGWTIDGEMFDSSIVRGTPATFPVDGLIPGFTEGLELMVVGEQRRLWIPSMLAYGSKPGAPHGTLVFDVELVSIAQP